jgi:hypothetical protein
MMFLGSGCSDGNAHAPDNLPILLAGRGGGTIRPGRHLQNEKNTPLCNLHLSILNRLGVPAERFGDSKQALDLS